MVARNDPCPCGSGKKYKKCCLDVNTTSKLDFNPDSRSARILELYNEIDYITESYLGKNPDHPCKIGCYECCSDIILVYPEEFSLMQLGINELMEDEINHVSRQVESHIKEINKKADFNKILSTNRDPASLDNMINTLKEIKSPCPFLSDGMCLVYEYRPLVCRMYGYIHLYDNKDGKFVWTSKCSCLDKPNFGIGLPNTYTDITRWTGIKDYPMTLIAWLYINYTNAIDFEKLFYECMQKPLGTPKLNHRKLLNELINNGVITPSCS